MIDRTAFVARWEARASEASDVFDQFFCLWLALIIQARPVLDPAQLDADDTDRAALVRLSAAHATKIVAALDDAKDHLT